MHPPPRQGARTDRRELVAVQSRALITVTERSRDRSGEPAERSVSGRAAAASGQHVPEAAAAERGPARRQAGALARVVPPPLLHDVHCIFRPICIHRSWRWRCVLPSILGISLVAWLARLVGPGGSRGVAGVRAGRAPRLLCIGWVRGSWARAGVRWRIIVAHVGCRICPAKEGNKQETWFAFVCSSTTV